MSRRRLSIVLVFAVLTASCSYIPKRVWDSGGPADNFVVDVEVDAISDPAAHSKRTFVIVPGNEGVAIDSLQFKEFASYVERALVHNGFIKADGLTSADLAVVLNYGIGDPQTLVQTRNIPIFGQTGIASSHTTASAYGNSYSSTTTNTPSYGVTGYVQQTESTTYFQRAIVVTAYDWHAFEQTKRQVEVWRTTITSSGTSSDMRQVFPVMVGGALSSFGRDTGKRVSTRVGDMEEAVLVVKGEQPQVSVP